VLSIELQENDNEQAEAISTMDAQLKEKILQSNTLMMKLDELQKI